MSDVEPHSEISELETQIERLAETAERCRKFILAAKVAIVVGALLLLALVFGFVRGPEALVGATATLIGGIVALGTHVSTLNQVVESLAAAERMRAQLIGRMNLRVVPDAAQLH